MTPERLAEIEARADAASDGPWAWYEYGEKCYAFAVCTAVPYFSEEEDVSLLSGHVDLAPPGISHTEMQEMEREYDTHYALAIDPICDNEEQSGSVDIPFIAHARQDIPDLLAYIDALNTELERQYALSDNYLAAIKRLQEEEAQR